VSAAALLTGIGAAVAQTNSAPNPVAQTTAGQRTHWWWKDPPVGRQQYLVNAKKLPLISVKGNHFEDPQGRTVVFRGVAINDPDELEVEGHWTKELFVKAREMGARIVRIPVHPAAWRERTPEEYVKLLEQAVEWCTDLDLYIDLDWHAIGNLTTGLFQEPSYATSQHETYDFWLTMARHFAGHDTMAFFELFDEPTSDAHILGQPSGSNHQQLGPINWMEWKRMVEEQIAIIRGYNPQVIPLVAGFDRAYDLTPLRLAPINAPGVGYVTHPYEGKRPRPWEPRWEEDFGFAADTYPVVATEFGGFQAPGATAPAGATAANLDHFAYGPEIFHYLEKKGISWIAIGFDPQWGPTLIRDWSYTLTPSGEFVKEALKGAMK
jgi:hypothetical protein